MANAWSQRFVGLRFGVAIVIAGVLCAAIVYTQAPASQAPAAPTPGTVDGKPDLTPSPILQPRKP